MKVIRCENNKHFYDAELYDACPHCRKEQGGSAPVGKKPPPSPEPAKSHEKQPKRVAAPFVPIQDPPVEDMPVSQNEPAPEMAKSPDANHTSSLWEQQHGRTGYIFDDEKKEAPPQKKDSAGEDLIQAVAAVTSHSASEDAKTVAFYDFGDEESPVVGWLVCVKGEYRGRSFDLKSGQNYIGRAQNMHVALARETSVSRNRHAGIIFDPTKQAFHIQKGESSGLAYLNGELVLEHALLNAYDTIRLGNAEFVFVPFCGDRFSWESYVKK